MKVKETKSVKESLTSEINRFCKKEYRIDKDPMTAKDFCLFAVDCGGYDTTDAVSFYANDDHFILKFMERTYDIEKFDRMKKFKFQVIEEVELDENELRQIQRETKK